MVHMYVHLYIYIYIMPSCNFSVNQCCLSLGMLVLSSGARCSHINSPASPTHFFNTARPLANPSVNQCCLSLRMFVLSSGCLLFLFQAAGFADAFFIPQALLQIPL